MPGQQLDTAPFEPAKPGTQKRRSLHDPWKDAAGGSDESLRAKSGRPVAHIIRREGVKGRAQALRGGAEALHEARIILGMSDVKARLPRQQKLRLTVGMLS